MPALSCSTGSPSCGCARSGAATRSKARRSARINEKGRGSALPWLRWSIDYYFLSIDDFLSDDFLSDDFLSDDFLLSDFFLSPPFLASVFLASAFFGSAFLSCATAAKLAAANTAATRAAKSCFMGYSSLWWL